MITLAIPEQSPLSGTPHGRIANQRGPTRPNRSVLIEQLNELDAAGSMAPEKALAAGVLRQATADLRRFRDSSDAVGREMYDDARRWFVSSETEWPYSFLNVCDSLGLSPETVREAVFEDEVSHWAAHSGRIAWATALQFVGSVSNLFAPRRSHALAVRHS